MSRALLCMTALAALALGSEASARVTHTSEPDTFDLIRRISLNRHGIVVDRNRAHADTLDGQGHGSTVTYSSKHPGLTVDVDEAGLVRVFSDAEVRAGERIDGDVVAVFGSVVVEGQVAGNVVSVFGSTRLTPGAQVDGDVVAIGGGLEQAPGATVSGESISLGFLPTQWGVPTLGVLLGVVAGGWLLTLFGAWLFTLLFPHRMLRIAETAVHRTLGSFVLGFFSAPLMVIAIVLLLITVIGIPIAILVPVVFMIAAWGGQMAVVYVLGCRLLRRPMGEGHPMVPMLAGSTFVAMFFALGAVLAVPAGVSRTVALFCALLGGLLVLGLKIIGTGAMLLSRFGTRARDIAPAALPLDRVHSAPAAPLAPPSTL